MAAGGKSPQKEQRFSWETQENVELSENRKTAKFVLRHHPTVFTTSRPLMKGDVLFVHLSGSGHAHLGLVTSKPSSADLQACKPVLSGSRDYLLHFRLKKTAAIVTFNWENSREIRMERLENGVVQSSNTMSEQAVWPLVDVHFGSIKVKLEKQSSSSLPPIAFHPSLHGPNVELKEQNMEVEPLVEIPQAFCSAKRALILREITKLDMKPIDNARWFWMKICVTTLEPKDIMKRNESSPFSALPKTQWKEIKKVRNPQGTIELAVKESEGCKHLCLTFQAEEKKFSLRDFPTDAKIFLFLELFRVEVSISSYIPTSDRDLYAMTYAPNKNTRPPPDDSLYLETVHLEGEGTCRSAPSPQVCHYSKTDSRQRQVASVRPFQGQLPRSTSSGSQGEVASAVDSSTTLLKQPWRSTSAPSLLDSEETPCKRVFEESVVERTTTGVPRRQLSLVSSRDAGSSEGILGEEETSLKSPTGENTDGTARVPSLRFPVASEAHPPSNQLEAQQREDEDEYDDCTFPDVSLALCGQPTSDPRSGYASLTTSPMSGQSGSQPGGTGGMQPKSPPAACSAPNLSSSTTNLRQTSQSESTSVDSANFSSSLPPELQYREVSVVRASARVQDGRQPEWRLLSLRQQVEDLRKFARTDPGSLGERFPPNVEDREGLVLELDWIQNEVDELRRVMRNKKEKDEVDKLERKVKKMSVRIKPKHAKSSFYNKLRNSYLQFLQMNAVPVAECLFQDKAITSEDMQMIVHEKTQTNQTRVLLGLLLCRPHAEECFRAALEYSEQGHLIPLLEESFSQSTSNPS